MSAILDAQERAEECKSSLVNGRTIRVYIPHDPLHASVLTAFALGICEVEGCKFREIISPVEEYSPSDVSVTFGVEKKAVVASIHRGRVIREQKSRGLQHITLEMGYLNRGYDPQTAYYSAGFGGINGWADFRNDNMPDDRLNALGIRVNTWRQPGERGQKILIAGQVPWDASVQDIPGGYLAWLFDTVVELKRRAPNREVLLRPHPKQPQSLPMVLGTTYSPADAPLADVLNDCWAVVAYNSNALVDAVMAGVPAFALGPGSVAWAMASNNLDAINDPPMPIREPRLADLAYAQWTLAEMREGRAWRHLMRG